jgi:AcrR family transcriptional regulator
MNKEKILELAKNLFWRFGIRSVTMNDIARELGMSKKTLYQNFQDKEDIVCLCLTNQINQDILVHDSACDNSQNAVDELLQIMDYHTEMMKNFHPSLLFDMQKYYPRAWELFMNYKDVFCVESIVKNIEKGIKEGFFYDDLDPIIIAKLRMEQVQTVFNPRIFPPNKFDIVYVHQQVSKQFIYSILNPTGWQMHKDLSTNSEK